MELGDNGCGRPALQLHALMHEHHSGLSPHCILLHSVRGDSVMSRGQEARGWGGGGGGGGGGQREGGGGGGGGGVGAMGGGGGGRGESCFCVR